MSTPNPMIDPPPLHEPPVRWDGHVAGANRAGWWWGAVGVASLMALIGLTRPEYALPMALVAAAGFGLLALGRALQRFLLRVRPTTRSVFAPARHERPRHPLPHHLARIAPDAGARDPALTSGARAGIATVATERLWARHGLNLHDHQHLRSIEHLVGPRLWNVIRPEQYESGYVVPRRSVRHAELDQLLDDLDQL